MLVIVFHTSIAYGAAGSWILVDVDTSKLTITSILLTIFTAVCQAFFMGLFFFLSSYFIPASYERKGAGRFIKDRLIRLGIPLVFYCFVIGPITGWFAHFRDRQSLTEFYHIEVWSFKQIFVGPAWFLEALLYFVILYTTFRLIRGKRAAVQSERPFPKNLTLLAAAVGIGFVAFVVRFVYPTGQGPLGLQFGYFPLYFLLFIVGLLAYRYNWIPQIPARTVKIWGWVAVCAIPVLPVGLILTGALEGNMTFAGGLNVQALVYAFWEPFICIGMILILLRLFQKHLHRSNPLRKWMSANAYTVYIIHPPVIVGWTIFMTNFIWPPAIKWLLVSLLSIICCFLLSAILRAIPGARRIL
ncbi:acyltransferase family protein [Paenibacillus cremeus]|uniref:Acyltransferase family protein n=2 Tax=Paenibacillus cremeus TaxID=2163881 RepID=A0A559K801_9BACL|nr:acyltransferase family protein [Paenibacillus cremeus]